MTTAEDFNRLLSYDDLTRRIWQDPRLPPGTRELALAIAHVRERDPMRPDGKALWSRVRELLGTDGIGQWRIWELINDDRPRYEPPRTPRTCQAPRIRPYKPRRPDTSNQCLLGHHPHLGPCQYTVVYADAGTPTELPASNTCDAPAAWDLRLVQRDPITGWYIEHAFCRRHTARFEQVKAQLAQAPQAPEPIPNWGGLLPCYFATTWANMYSKVAPHWKEPVYGLIADEWPSVGVKVPVVAAGRPKLRLIAGGLDESTEESA